MLKKLESDFEFKPELKRLYHVTYGLVSSPHQANRTIRQLASDHQSVYPDAADVIYRECYMDDMLSGEYSFTETVDKLIQLVNLLEKGNFELQK